MSFDSRTQAFRIYTTVEEVLRVDCINVLLILIPQSFDWLAAFHLDLLEANLFIAVLLRVILHRAPSQVADRGTLSRYRG